MTVYNLPEFIVGDSKDPIHFHFYKRHDADNLDKLKLNLSQNMMSIMIKGHKDVIDDEHHLSISSNELLLIPAGRILMSERTTVDRQYESLILFFSNEFLADFLKKYDIQINTQGEDHYPVLVLEKDEYLMNFQRSMILLSNELNKLSFKTAKLEELMLYLLHQYPAQMRSFIQTCLTTDLNRSLVTVVQQNVFSGLNYQELAFLCHMSVSTFKRKFLEVYDMTPKKYFVTKKMKQAEFLLRQRKRPSDIYFELGYESLSSFSLE